MGFVDALRGEAADVSALLADADLHRWDLATAIGQPADLDPGLANDGIDEGGTMFFPRQVRLGRQPPLTDTVAVVDAGSDRRWVLEGDGTNHQP